MHYQNGYGILFSEHGSILDSIENAIENMNGKTYYEEVDSNYAAKKKLILDGAAFVGRSAIPICEVEKRDEDCTSFRSFLDNNEDGLDAFILCYVNAKN